MRQTFNIPQIFAADRSAARRWLGGVAATGG
jgi:hypothetical protein